MRLAIPLSLASLLIGAPLVASTQVTAPLIERSSFFGNLAASQGLVSPDGKWLSWLAPRDGVMNVWIAPVSAPAQARPLTQESMRAIRQYLWSPDSSTILYLNDKTGDENYALYATDLAGRTKALTPTEKARTYIAGTSSTIRNQVAILINDRDPRWFDVYRLNLKTGERTLLLKNEGQYVNPVVDDRLNLRMVQRVLPDGNLRLYRVTSGKVETEPFDQLPADDTRNTATLGLSIDGKTLYWLDSRGRDTAALVAQDMASGTKRILAQDSRADIVNPRFDPKTGVPDAYAINYMKTEWKPLNAARRADLSFLEKRLKGELRILSRSDNDHIWVVSTDPGTSPVTAYVYDRARRSLSTLYVSQPKLETARLAPVHPLVIQARDGLPMVSYLTLPVGTDPDGNGRPNSPLPTVLTVHGGPWLRDSYGYNARAQWLANRGYAVLTTNFRGSSGFGKNFLSAGDRQWGAAMQNDLVDAMDWAIANRVSQPDKIAIMGQSYGGYAALVGLAFTPEKFACGVSTAGETSLETLIAATPSAWEAAKADIYRRIGDPRTEEGRADLRARSPLHKADRIRRPLLIGQGANDPRVPKAEPDQIVAAMRKEGIPVTYVVFPDEGHNYVRPQNLIAFNAVAENFLSGCLGGRAEPYNGVIEASSMIVESEAPYTPGLIEASRAAAAGRIKTEKKLNGSK